MMIFKDRESAGELLAKRLVDYKNKQNMIVLGIPRGGVVVASEIAKKLRLPLDIVVTRKIGAPFQKELALGAVDPVGNVVWEESLIEDTRVSKEELAPDIEREVEEIKRRQVLYRQNKPPLDVSGKMVILVDDGVATGSTITSAIRFLKSAGSKGIILAVPVAAKESVRKVSEEVLETVVFYAPEYLVAVGSFYQNFNPVSDEEVIELLK